MQMNIIRVACQHLLIALAITAALAMPGQSLAAVSGNVTLYGEANVSYDTINTGTASGISSSQGITSSRLASNSSFVGLKGSSELGSGWEALVQAEVTLGTDTGASGCQVPDAATPTKSSRWKCFFDRNTYLGVSSTGYGTLLAGRHDTPYKMATRRLDIFAGGIADNRSLMGTTIPGGANRVLSAGPPVVVYSNHPVTETFDARLSDLLLYTSPGFGGFSLAIGYSNLAESNAYAGQPGINALSLAAMYEEGPVYATIAYEDHTTSQKDSQNNDLYLTVKATKLGLGYKLGILDLGFAYEKSRDDFGNLDPYDGDPNSVTYNPCGGLVPGANCSGHGTLYLSAKIGFTDNDALKIAYTKAGQVGAASTDTGALQFAMGLDHDFNERTTAYFLYASLKNDQLVRYGLSTAASSGDNSVNPTGIGGASPSVLSFGMKHSF
ncbi:MAG: porin [Pseudomonadota bacterium]